MKRIGLISILLGLGIINAYPQDSIVSIPDTAFLHALIEEGVDTNGDRLISYEEAQAVTSLNIGESYANPGEISDMEGIKAFINSRELYCYHNSLNSLDVSNNSSLEDWRCFFNKLTSLDFSGCRALEFLDISNMPNLHL